MTRNLPRLSLAVLAGVLAAAPLRAQSIEGAIAAYKANDYAESAVRFYEVLKFDTDEGNQAEAEFGLAQSFQKMGLYLPAIKYYEDIIQAGNQHTYYFKAFEGILDAGDALNDDLKVPAVLDKAYGNSLKKLDSAVLQRVHYAIGELMYRQGKPKDAKDFLGTVKKGNKAYAKAQYLLGLLRLGLGRRDKGKVDRDAALKHFQNVLAEVPAGSGDAEKRKMRDLATFGVARVLYEDAAPMEEDNPERKAKLQEALRYYDMIPRLHPMWGQAMFEKAWTMFLLNEYGQALGLIHSLQAPYFSDRYQPELHVLKSLVYYFNCHYDRVYKALKIFEDEYKPLLEEMKKLNAEERDGTLWYEFMVKSVAKSRLSQDPAKVKNDGLLPIPVARSVAQDPQWEKLEFILRETARELGKVKGSKLGEGPLGEELVQLIKDAQANFMRLTGRWAQRASKQAEDTLAGFLKQGVLVRLETTTAEQQWVEAGKDLQGNVVRRRLPRPYIPDDTYVYWNWRQEYWADELGSYRYAIKSECIE